MPGRKTFEAIRLLKTPLLRWVAAFTGCVLVVVGIMAWVSFSMVDGIVESIQKNQLDRMESIRVGMDMDLTNTLNAAYQMVNDANLQILSDRTRPYTSYQTSLLLSLNQKLRLFVTSHAWENVALYFSIGEYAQEGSAFRRIEDIHANWGYAISFEEWRQKIVSLRSAQFFTFASTTGATYAELWCPLRISPKRESRGVFIIRLKTSAFATLLQSMSSYPNERLTLRDAEGNVICWSGEPPTQDGAQWRTVAVRSSVCNWYYESSIDEAFLIKPADQYRRLAVIVCVSLLVLGVALSVALGVRNFMPIERLYEATASIAGEDALQTPSTSREMYECIEQSYSMMRANYNSANARLQRQHLYVRNHLLQRLLSRAWNDESLYFSPVYEENGISFSCDNFRVLMVECLNADDMYKDESYSDADKLTQYLINDVFEEKFSKEYEAMFLRYEDHSVGILSVPDHQSTSRIEKLCEELAAQIDEKYALKLCCILSGCYPTLSGISECYNDVLERNEIRQLTGTYDRCFMDCSDLPRYSQTPTRFSYNIEKQMRLIQYVKDDNFAEARKLVGEILDSEALYTGSADIMRLAMFSLINTMLDAVWEIGTNYDDNLMSRFNVTKRLLDCTSISALHKETIDLFTEIENYINTSSRNSRKVNIVESVKDYVAQQYTDPDLSVSAIAETMGMPISTLSRMFKNKVGCGLLEYINKMRVEAVAKRLAHTDMKLSQIAGETGFINVNTMIRIFKRYIGVTPGKYAQTLITQRRNPNHDR